MTTETYGMGSFADEFIWLHNEHARIGALLDEMRQKIRAREVAGPDLIGGEMEITVVPVEREVLDIEKLTLDLGITPELLDTYLVRRWTDVVMVRAKASDPIKGRG
jgi:hypothetical protein